MIGMNCSAWWYRWRGGTRGGVIPGVKQSLVLILHQDLQQTDRFVFEDPSGLALAEGRQVLLGPASFPAVYDASERIFGVVWKSLS